MITQPLLDAIEQYQSIPMVRRIIQEITIEHGGPGTHTSVRVATRKGDGDLVLRLHASRSSSNGTYVLTERRTDTDAPPRGIDFYSDIGDGLTAALRRAFEAKGFDEPRLPRIAVPTETPASASAL